MNGTGRHLIVTGGRGYIGRAVIDAALAADYRVTVLSRDGAGLSTATRHVQWQLGEILPAEALCTDLPAEAQSLVHLAHDWTDTRIEGGTNLSGTCVLRDSARQLGLGRLIFISSQSARDDALNAYGRMKRHIERLFDRPEEVSLRVGLVYGGPWNAQYGLLCRLVMATSVMPMIAPHQTVQPVHRNEVARGILLAAERDVDGTLGLASSQPIPFSQFLDILARLLRGGGMWLVPIPLRPMLWLCALANRLPYVPRIDRERILGLAGTRPMETAADLERLGLIVLPFAEGMAAEPASRRAVLAEGRALLRYILGTLPSGALMRRYARAAAMAGPTGAMRLGKMVRMVPQFLRLIEPFGGRSILQQRLRIALALAEASPEGTLALQRRGRSRRLLALAAASIPEFLCIPTRLIAAALRRD